LEIDINFTAYPNNHSIIWLQTRYRFWS